MNRFSFFFFFVILSMGQLASAQNLIVNPGFESSTTGWDPLWLRTANSGQGSIVSSPVHSGNAAYHIKHSGSDDWSFRQSVAFPVRPGQIYEFSAWANVISSNDTLHLSVALFDSAANSLTWEYVYQHLPVTNGTFQKFTIRFLVPEGARTMWPRFIGSGNNELTLDDVQLIFMGSQVSGKYQMEDSVLQVSFATSPFGFTVSDKRIGKVYSFPSPLNATVNKVDTAAQSLYFHTLVLGDSSLMGLQLTLVDNKLKFSIIPESTGGITQAVAFPGFCTTQAGDYLVLPYAAGLLIPVEEKFPFYQISFSEWKSTMSFGGITNLRSGYLVISDDPWDTELHFANNETAILNSINLYHKPSKGSISTSRSGVLLFLDDGGYAEMARQYRAIADTLGYTKTFGQKVRENPSVQNLAGAVDFWLMDGPFYNLRFIDSLRLCGIDRAIYSLYEWGTNSEWFPKFIDSLNSRNLLTSKYDNYIDIYPPHQPIVQGYRTDGYPQDIVIQADGSMKKNWLAYLSDGSPYQAYFACQATQAAYAKQTIQTELTSKHYNARFIDVELAVGLIECYSPTHPLTRHDDALSRKALLQAVKEQCNLVTGDEECHDWAFSVTDYGEGTMSIGLPTYFGYDWMTPTDTPGVNYYQYSMNPVYRIPLHGLAFHDCHVPTWYTGDGISKVPNSWDLKDAFTALYAAMPLFMPPSANYWWQNKLRFLTSANLVTAVSRSCGFEKMTSHQFLTSDRSVQSTTFGNGWTVTANFGSDPFSSNSIQIPGKGFYATNGSFFAGKFLQNNTPVAAVRLADRIFLSSASTTELSGLRVNGAAMLIKNADMISLAFIGDQDFIDVNPSIAPWPLKVNTLRTYWGNSPVTAQDLGDGWYRINKNNGERFYSMQTSSSPSGTQAQPAKQFTLELGQNYPNPFNSQTTIGFSIPKAGKVILRIYNIMGSEIAELCNGQFEPGNYSLHFDAAKLTSGIYFYALDYQGKILSKKFALVK